MNTLSMEAIETGIDCWDRDIQRFVRSRRISEYHPFTAYFEQLPEWDGKDRVSALARRVSDDPVWVNGFHRWMLGLSAQWMQFHPDTNNANSANSINRANSVAPLLVSSRQGLGKSTFCRLLMPDALKAYYTESYDLGSPASAEAKLAACGLINLDEFDKLSASKSAPAEEPDASLRTEHPQGLQTQCVGTALHRLVHRHQQPGRPAGRPHRLAPLPLCQLGARH